MADKLWSAFEKGEKALNSVFIKEGLYTPEAISYCLNIYRKHYPKIAIYSDAPESICSLKSQGVHLGLITDGSPEGQRAKIKGLNIEQFFEKIIITNGLGCV